MSSEQCSERCSERLASKTTSYTPLPSDYPFWEHGCQTQVHEQTVIEPAGSKGHFLLLQTCWPGLTEHTATMEAQNRACSSVFFLCLSGRNEPLWDCMHGLNFIILPADQSGTSQIASVSNQMWAVNGEWERDGDTGRGNGKEPVYNWTRQQWKPDIISWSICSWMKWS